jgi:hypothetical protein
MMADESAHQAAAANARRVLRELDGLERSLDADFGSEENKAQAARQCVEALGTATAYELRFHTDPVCRHQDVDEVRGVLVGGECWMEAMVRAAEAQKRMM